MKLNPWECIAKIVVVEPKRGVEVKLRNQEKRNWNPKALGSWQPGLRCTERKCVYDRAEGQEARSKGKGFF